MRAVFLFTTLLQTALAAVLCFVPLFDVLGYEFALAQGGLACLTAHALGRVAGREAPSAEAALRLAWTTAAGHLLVGLALIALNALRVRNCDVLEGLGFWVLLPLATSLYSSTWGVLVARVLPRARPWQTLGSATALLCPLLATLEWLYAEPAIFAYDHLFGYLAGSLYDEALTLSSTLGVWRAMTLARVLALAALVIAWEARARRGARPVIAAFASLLAVMLLDRVAGPAAGYLVSRADIEAELPQRVLVPGWVIHLPADLDDELVEDIRADHAFRLQLLNQRLALPFDPARPVHSYVYRDAAQKARLMGGERTQIAKPWRREIHIHGPAAEHGILAHELVHALAADFGDPLLGISRSGLLPNMLLVEGLAEALTLPRGARDLHSEARAMRDVGLAPDLRVLLRPGTFWGYAPRRAYTLAGSFVRHLIDTHGVAAFKAAYADGDLATHYGAPVSDLVDDWEAMLDARPVLDRDRADARHTFRTPSVFDRPCAHVIATLRARAQRSSPRDALALQREICRHLGDSSAARLDVADAQLAAGDEEGYLAASLELLADPTLTEVQHEKLWGERGMLLWARGQHDAARVAFTEAQARAPDLSSERLRWVQLWALGLAEPLREHARGLLSEELAPVAAVLAFDHALQRGDKDPTLAYLIGRHLQQKEADDGALDYLQRHAPHPFLPIEAERLRLLAEVEQRRHAWSAAAETYRRYADLVPVSGARTTALDLVERVAFMSRWPRAGDAPHPRGSHAASPSGR